jgi:hypothetical protein
MATIFSSVFRRKSPRVGRLYTKASTKRTHNLTSLAQIKKFQKIELQERKKQFKNAGFSLIIVINDPLKFRVSFYNLSKGITFLEIRVDYPFRKA